MQPDNATVPADSTTRQLRSFAVAGVGGFAVDALSLLALLHLGAGPYAGRAVSYLMAATATWLYNRTFTFKPAGRRSLFEEWLFYVTSQLSGAALNLSVYSVLITFVPLFTGHPVLSVAAGSLAGLTANFLVARHFVFRASPADKTQDGLPSGKC
jgi:putative flippase GtrA